MAGSVNKVILIGNLGADPESRSLSNGSPVVNLRVATPDRRTDKASGQERERPEWHRGVTVDERPSAVARNSLAKGPSWSPDGSRLAFSSYRDGDAVIYLMEASDGSGVTRLTFSAEDDLAPAWSPDGTQIVFVSAREGAFEVMIINVDGTGETNLSNHETSDSNPRWVPARTQ